jgi:thioredoxin 1
MKKRFNASASMVAAVVLSCALTGGVFDASSVAQETKPKAKAKDSKPAVFSNVSFEEARESTEGNEKILIVKGTAEWCGPCKQMDKTTWKDEAVVKWVKDNGLAISVDVDKEQKVARKLSIQAMPTMIAFKDGKEVDRIVGYRSAKQLLSWASDVKAGKTTKVIADEEPNKTRGTGDDVDTGMQERLQLARRLVQSKKHDDAMREYVLLWKNVSMKEPKLVNVNTAILSVDMKELAEVHEPAKREFSKLRDETEARLKGDAKSFTDLTGWICLNTVLADNSRTLDWVDGVKHRPTASSTFSKVEPLLEPLLKESGRIGDLGLVLTDPIGRIKRSQAKHKILVRMPTPEADRNSEQARAGMFFGRNERFLEILHEECAFVYQAMLAAKREDAARAAAEQALQYQDTREMRLELVRAALAVNEARIEHRKMLQNAIDIKPGHFVSATTQDIDSAASELERMLNDK